MLNASETDTAWSPLLSVVASVASMPAALSAVTAMSPAVAVTVLALSVAVVCVTTRLVTIWPLTARTVPEP